MDGGPNGRRAAANQRLYRSVNERIKALNEVLADVAAIESEWICECVDVDCTLRVTATLLEYEAVRANPNAFIVRPDHIGPDDVVVTRCDRFTVVEPP